MKDSSRVLALEVAVLVVLTGALMVVRRLAPITPGGSELIPGQVAMALGFALLAAHLLGRLLARAQLPQISGYLLAGVILGPYVLGMVSLEVKNSLSIVNEIALGLIALTAGGELAIERVRPRLRAITAITALHAVFIFVGTAGALLVLDWTMARLGAPLHLTEGLTGGQLLAMGLILGLVATAKSPASTVAVIGECRAAGPMTTVALGVTVVKDVIVILLMGVTLTLAQTLVSPEHALDAALAGRLLLEIVVSLVMGLMLGWFVLAYLRRIQRETALFLLVAVFLAIEVSRLSEVHFDIRPHFLVVCMTAGFVVENMSSLGRALIAGIERSSLPVYVVFFTLAGVGLDLDSLVHMWPLALAFVVWRGLLIYGTTWTGASLAGETARIRNLSWTAFLTQAGVSLGLAELVASRYPEMGDRIKTLVLAVIALNQIVGPVLFKWALRRSGEAGAAVDES